MGVSPGPSVSTLQGSSSWIASPALKGTIVLAQCRSWLLSEEEARCRQLLNHINTDKHHIKTQLQQQSEDMQNETNKVKAELAALRAKEEKLRRDLDESSTTYLRLYRDPKVSRGNDAMLREKQRSNELWNDLESLIHERNAANTRLQKLEASNMLIIQNLYQTQVLLATQVEKERQRMGADDSEEEARAKQRQHRLSRSASILSTANSNGTGATVDDPPTSPSVIQPVSPVDAKIADEVSRLTSLRNSEINLQKKLSKFLGLREQVQSYLLKIAGFQKKLAAQQMQQAQARAIRQMMKTSSAPSSGRQSPSSSTPPSPGRARPSSILKQSFGSGANSQPITIGAQGATHQRRDSGSGVHSVFRPSPDTPEQGSAVPPAASSSVSPPSSSSASPSPHAHMSSAPHQLLVPRPGSAASSTASASPAAVPARSVSPTASTSPSAASSPSRGVAASSSRAHPSSSSSGASSLSGSSPAPSLLLSSHGRSASQTLQSLQSSSSTLIAPPSTSPSSATSSAASSAFNSERDRIEKSQLAHLVFDQRNRKVLQRICEAFHRSGLPSARKWKAGRKAAATTAASSFSGSLGGIVIQNAFLGVELITWILNIGLSSQRADALILLELLLRAGLIDMIQESSESTEENVSASGGGLASLRINAHSQFGDMKLQFALYRLRGDSSDAGKLSKSGWLFKVSRWRVHRRYFAWDVDVHRLALFHSNKDENPARVYYLGASTVISAVEDATAAQQAAAAAAQAAAAAAGRDGSAPAVPSLVRGASAGSNSGPAGMIPPDSLSKFYFQLHLHPPQNDESSLLLYASSARERAEWLKVLWLSGCEYPTLASTVHANQGFVTNKPGQPGAGVAPGSRPNPIHPSVLLGAQQPLGAHNHAHAGAATAAIHQSILGHAPSSSAHSALDSETDEEAEEEDTYYEDEQDDQSARQQADVDEMRHQRPRYAADDASGGAPMLRATFTRGSSVSSAPTVAPVRSGSLASASFSSFSTLPSGSGGSGAPVLRRRASLADKKNESDLMGVFALRRAKAKFALQAAWTKMLDTRRKNLDKRSKLRAEQRRIAAEERAAAIAKAAQPQFLGSPSSAAATNGTTASTGAAASLPSNGADATSLSPLPSADGLDLGWCEMFIPGYDSADDEADSAATVSGASHTPTTAAGERRNSRSSSPSRGSGGSGSKPGSLDVVVVDSEDEDGDDNFEDDDDLGQDGDQSDYNSEDENGDLSVITADGGNAHPDATATNASEDPEQTRARLRKQRFQLLSNSLTSLLQLPAAPVAAAPASSSSADASAPSSATHPLTAFVSTYVRQFVELYTGALELNLANPLIAPGAANGAVRNPWIGTNSAWPPAQRASGTSNGAFLPQHAQFGTTTDASVPRAREKLDATGSPELAPSNPEQQKQPSWSPSPIAETNEAAPTDPANSAADDELPPSPPVLYPYSRHARAVLAAAKEDVRQLLYQLNQVVADALAVCETALRKEAERERKAQAAADKKAGVAVSKRASSRRTDPAIRRIERDLSLLSRLCSGLLSHQVFTLVHSALFSLYAVVHARRNFALQAQIFNHRSLTFKQMGLADELIFSAAADSPNDAQGMENEGHAISYQHASQ